MNRILILMLSLLAALSTAACTSHHKTHLSDADRQKMNALDDALKNGLISEADYDAKVAKLASGESDAPVPTAIGGVVLAADHQAPARSAPSGGVRMKTVAIWDPAFNMPAFKMMVPADWSFEGIVLRAPCASGPQIVYRASSPDGLTGIQKLPRYDWSWVDDGGMAQSMRAQHCTLGQPLKAADFARATMMPEARAGATVEGTEADPGEQKLQEQVRTNNAQLAANSHGQEPWRQSADAVRLRLAYSYNGKPVEEFLTVTTTTTDQPMPSFRGGVIHRSQSQGTATGLRAPRGQLQASEKMLVAIRDSLVPNPQWQQRVQEAQNQQFQQMQSANQQAFQATMKYGEDAQRQRTQQHEAFMNQMEQQRQTRNQQFQQHMEDKAQNAAAFNAKMDARSARTADYQDFLLDQQRFYNPSTGTVTTQSNQYNHTFQDGSGNVVQTDSPTFDPNAQLPGSWTQLQPIRH